MTAVAVHHLVEGPADAPPLVLANSLGSTLAMWEPQVEDLAQHFRLVRFDLRGHGASPVPPGPYSVGDLAEDLRALLDLLEIERAHLCGVSLGGMTAMRLALDAPERVGGLVLCCTSARMRVPETYAERAETVRRYGTPAVADAVVLRWVTPGFAAAHPDRVRQLRAMVASTPAEGYAGCCEALAGMDLEHELPRISAPTLAIAGADDQATPPDHAARIAARIPGARMAVVPNAAHLANIEQPADVTRLILRHLL